MSCCPGPTWPENSGYVTSAEAAADASLRGVGLSRSLHYQVHDGLQAGKLSIVLAKYELEPFPVHLVHAARGQLPLKMRRFLDFAAPRLRAVLDDVNEIASRATILES
jgi:DNA-binding transcriptional LysR family regulator